MLSAQSFKCVHGGLAYNAHIGVFAMLHEMILGVQVPTQMALHCESAFDFICQLGLAPVTTVPVLVVDDATSLCNSSDVLVLAIENCSSQSVGPIQPSGRSFPLVISVC